MEINPPLTPEENLKSGEDNKPKYIDISISLLEEKTMFKGTVISEFEGAPRFVKYGTSIYDVSELMRDSASRMGYSIGQIKVPKEDYLLNSIPITNLSSRIADLERGKNREIVALQNDVLNLINKNTKAEQLTTKVIGLLKEEYKAQRIHHYKMTGHAGHKAYELSEIDWQGYSKEHNLISL